MIIHFANLDDVGEWGWNHDWPVRSGMTLQAHLHNVLSVYYNEKEEYRCATQCFLVMLCKSTQDSFRFSAIIRQTDASTKEDKAFRVDGHMNVYARIDLDETTSEYHPRMFSHIIGEELPHIDVFVE